MQIEVGQTIAGYEVIGVLGVGGMGKVFQVRNVISERIEAMKVLRPDASHADSAERFLREIKVQARFHHPNIAVLHSAVKLDDQILMIMELVEGLGLDELLSRAPLDPAQAVVYASQCLRALEYAHQHGVVHRDIKPSNIIVSGSGVVKLVDFGIARGRTDLQLTDAGMAVGSVHYMSPEQAMGQDVDERDDIYAMGITLYEMLTGVRPFTGATSYAVLKEHVEKDPVPPSQLSPGLSPELSSAVLRAFAKDRGVRFGSAAAFRQAIEGVGAPLGPTREITAFHSVPESSTTARIASCLATQVGPIASHLVKQASSRTTNVRELCLSLAEQIKDETRRHSFLQSCEKELRMAPLSLSKAVPTPTAPSTTGASRPSAWDPRILDRVKKELALYLGPLSKVLVDRASKQTTSLDELYRKLAGELSSEADRAKFLASK